MVTMPHECSNSNPTERFLYSLSLRCASSVWHSFSKLILVRVNSLAFTKLKNTNESNKRHELVLFLICLNRLPMRARKEKSECEKLHWNFISNTFRLQFNKRFDKKWVFGPIFFFILTEWTMREAIMTLIFRLKKNQFSVEYFFSILTFCYFNSINIGLSLPNFFLARLSVVTNIT